MNIGSVMSAEKVTRKMFRAFLPGVRQIDNKKSSRGPDIYARMMDITVEEASLANDSLNHGVLASHTRGASSNAIEIPSHTHQHSIRVLLSNGPGVAKRG